MTIDCSELWAAHARLGVLGDAEEPLRMAAFGAGAVVFDVEPVQCELPDRLQHAEADLSVAGGNREDEAGVREHGQAGQDIQAGFLAGADSGRGLRREPAGQHGDAAEQAALAGREQVVAPADRGAQGLLASREVACAGLEQRLVAVQPLQHRLRTQNGGA